MGALAGTDSFQNGWPKWVFLTDGLISLCGRGPFSCCGGGTPGHVSLGPLAADQAAPQAIGHSRGGPLALT